MFEHLREDVASVLARDPAARSKWEVLTCYPGIHAVMASSGTLLLATPVALVSAMDFS